ncbi:hypothetical protein GN956_G9615 [Arapaima gigas]
MKLNSVSVRRHDYIYDYFFTAANSQRERSAAEYISSLKRKGNLTLPRRGKFQDVLSILFPLCTWEL